MKVLIIGAAGMIGRKLTARLVRDGKLAGKAITNAHLVDVVAPQPPEIILPDALLTAPVSRPRRRRKPRRTRPSR